MRILIVVPQQDHASGNWVTARRFQQGLEKLGHRVITLETRLQEDASFQGKLLDFAADIALLLHAYRSGKPWLENAGDLMIPSVVMLTGTDVNHGLDDPQQSDIIQTVIEQAVFVMLQNPIIATAVSRDRPTLATRLKIIPPAVILGHGIFDLRATLGVAQELPLFLMPAGLRPVKGAIGLLKIFDQLGAKGDSFHLAFCGPLLDEDYGRRFRAEVETRSWASYLGVIEPEAMAAAMRSADVIINNSISEGLANSLLEAATLGIPILARNNQGNAALVRHDVNGLLYDDDNGCVRQATRLLEKEYRLQLSRPEPSYNPDMEAKALEALLTEAVSHRPKAQIIASSG